MPEINSLSSGRLPVEGAGTRRLPNPGEIASHLDTVLEDISNSICSGVLSLRDGKSLTEASSSDIEKRLVCISTDELVVTGWNADFGRLSLSLEDYQITIGYSGKSQNLIVKAIHEEVLHVFGIPREQAVTGKWLAALESIKSPGLQKRIGPAMYLPPVLKSGDAHSIVGSENTADRRV